MLGLKMGVAGRQWLCWVCGGLLEVQCCTTHLFLQAQHNFHTSHMHPYNLEAVLREARAPNMPRNGAIGHGALALLLSGTVGSLLGKLIYQLQVGSGVGSGSGRSKTEVCLWPPAPAPCPPSRPLPGSLPARHLLATACQPNSAMHRHQGETVS